MRRALGLGSTHSAQPAQRRSEPAHTRSRYVRDGEVPVVVLNRSREAGAASDRGAAATRAALVAEQTSRATAERSLAEALATVRSLQAQLAHAELAHGEVLAAERRVRERAEAALREIVAPLELAERQRGEAAPMEAVETPTRRAKVKRAALVKPRTLTAKTREPQPVKWWLSSYKAAKQGR